MYILSLVKSLRPCRREHWIMLSILVYSLVGVLKYYLPNTLSNALMTLSAFIFIIVVCRHASGFHLKGITGLFYGVLIIWSLCLTFHMFFIADIRSTFVDYHGLTTWLLAYFGSPLFLPNLIPFVILAFPRDYEFDFRYLWRVMWLLCILYMCYYPFAFWNMTHYSWSMERIDGSEWGDKGTYGDFITNSTMGIAALAPVVIMVFFKRYLPSKYWICFLASYVGSILIAAFLARRGGLALSVSFLVLAWIMYALSNKETSTFEMILMAAIVVGIAFVLFTNMADSFFSTLVGRGDENTRIGVEESFYSDMKSQVDWTFGRGWFGRYYDPLFSNFRSSIETGYLALILRGGLLYLIPYVVTLGITAFTGYFKSNNLFCKSFAIMCLMQIISLYPYGWPAFNFFHLIIWLGVWACNDNSIRNMTDQEISLFYFE